MSPVNFTALGKKRPFETLNELGSEIAATDSSSKMGQEQDQVQECRVQAKESARDLVQCQDLVMAMVQDLVQGQAKASDQVQGELKSLPAQTELLGLV